MPLSDSIPPHSHSSGIRPAIPASEDARLALIGHDLRAAVSDIVGGLRLIDQDSLNDAIRLQLGRIRAASEGLARLLEEALSMMLGDEDFAATHPATLQVARFLDDIDMRWSGRALEKRLNFRLTRAADVPGVLVLDRTALDRILANLLSNAFKYADSGQVDLDVSLAPDGSLRFDVTDRGPGFSDEALGRLFEFRSRPDDSGKPGDGLGLFIARNLSDRMGATLTATNRHGGGACLCLAIPPDRWTLAAPEAAAELPDLSRVKILVAEDNQTNRTIIASMLAKMGAQFELAEDGVEAMHWLERENFDLALIDIEMPRLSGFDVIRALRANDRLHTQMPIVAVTAYVLRTARDAIYAAGADAILTKPLAGLETFGAAIAATLVRGTAATPADAAATPAAEPAATLPFDRRRFDHLLQIAGPETGGELLERLAADLHSVSSALSVGLDEQDTDTLRAQTHVLIALAGAVGADALVAQAQRVNALAHRRAPEAFGALARAMLAGLDGLIRFVGTERHRRAQPE